MPLFIRIFRKNRLFSLLSRLIAAEKCRICGYGSILRAHLSRWLRLAEKTKAG
jgi:hypothetical protein